MRRFCAISASLCLFASFFLGCAQKSKTNDDDKKTDPGLVVKVDDKTEKTKLKVKTNGTSKDPEPVGKPIDEEQRQQYEAALGDALVALRDRRWNEALAAFEMARGFASTKEDTDFVKGEIEKLTQRAEQENVAETTVKNIETVLNDGDAEEAGKLANAALKEFGDRDEAAKLIQLALQAEALKSAQKNEDKEARFARFKKQAELARDEKNLRAEVLALEQALEVRDDANLKAAYETARGNLDKYDALRKQATELRNNPATLDEALEALKGAAAAWPTNQVRAEIDDLELAKQKRRDTVSVADFELRNDVGMPDAGSALADELLPFLKPKYDLVERGQFGRVVNELNLQRGALDDPKVQQRVGKLTNVRYLVVGTVSRLVGVTVRARLVDVQSGLVVQTGKIAGADMEETMRLVPDLARQLLMADEDKMKLDEVVVRQVEKAPDNAPIPMFDVKAPPPPAPMFDPAPPMFVERKAEVFKKFVPAPEVVAAPPPDPLQDQARNRLLFAAVEMGDFLLRGGRHAEAKRQFDFALVLAPDNFDIQMRVVQVQPFVPPPAKVVYVPRPRVVFMPFMTVGRPLAVPPSLSTWTPSHLSPYFAWEYDVADPGEVYWYMGRMGLTMQDVLVDPVARRWLARAAGVRYFVFGSCVETASFDVNTYLIDAETGYLRSSASIHVRNTHELKLRLGELAQLTMMDPIQQAQYLAAKRHQDFARLVGFGKKHMDEGRYGKALDEFNAALQIYPDNIQVRLWQIYCRDRVQFEQFHLARQAEIERARAAAAARHRNQWLLAQQAEEARRRAIAEAAARSEADRKARVAIRVDAQAGMVTRAQVALKVGNVGLSVNIFKGAVELAAVVGGPTPAPVPPVVYQDFAKARYEAERAEQVRTAQFNTVYDKKVADRYKAQLVQTRIDLDAERKASEAKLEAVRAEQAARDEKAYNASVSEGRSYLTKKKYEAALASFQAARRFATTEKQIELVNTQIDIIVQEQAEQLAKKDPQRKKDFDRKLAAENDARKAAKLNDEAYRTALKAGQQALAGKDYASAQAKFQAAGELFMTDAVQSGLRETKAGLDAQAAEAKRAEAEKSRGARVKQWLDTGNTAFDAKKFGEALQAYRQAKKLDPSNLDVIAALTRAEQAFDRQSADMRTKADDVARTKNFERLLKSGKDNLATKQYEAAVASLTEAIKLNPTDASAKAALSEAKKALDASLTDAKAQAAAKERAANYQKLLSSGKLALENKRFADAIKAFTDAQAILPGDKTSQALLQDAQSAKKAAEDAVAAAAKKRAEEIQIANDLKKALTQAKLALASKDFDAASKAIAQAEKLGPDNNDVKTARRDLEQGQKQAAAEIAAKKERLQQFQTFLESGKKAMASKRYGDAVKAFASAAALQPDSKEVQNLYGQAQTEARQFDDLAAKEKLLKAEYQAALSQGQKAMLAKDYDNAIKSAQAALKLMPKDAAAQTLLQQAQDAAGLAAKAGAAFQKAIDAGKAAMMDKKYAEAVKAFGEATMLNKTDATARMLLLQAQTALAEANAQTMKLANFTKAMSAGEAAIKGKRYGDAVKSFGDALKIFPDDKTAKSSYQEAQQLLKDSTKIKTPDPAKDFAEAMQRGAAAEKDQKYTDAAKAFAEALKLRPKDADAQAGWKKNQFSAYLAQGQQHLDNGMFKEAEREFTSALQLMPMNPQATKLLQKAKNKMK